MELLLSKDMVGVGHDSLPIVEFPLNCYVAAAISKFYRVKSVSFLLPVSARWLQKIGIRLN